MRSEHRSAGAPRPRQPVVTPGRESREKRNSGGTKLQGCKCTIEVHRLLEAEKGYGLDLAMTIPTRRGEKSVSYPQIRLATKKRGAYLVPTFCPFCGKKYPRE